MLVLLGVLSICNIVVLHAQGSGSLFDCYVRRDGIYPDPGSCDQYFVCTNGQASVIMCLGGQLYNQRIYKCDDPKNVNCTTSQKSSSGNSAKHTFNCTGKVNSFYASPYACNEYYICARGHAILARCSTGLLFNSSLKYCDLPANVQCQPGQYVPPIPTLPMFLPPLGTTHAPTPGPLGTHSSTGSTLVPPFRTNSALKTHKTTKQNQHITTQLTKASTKRHHVTKNLHTTIQQRTTHARTMKSQQPTKPIIPLIPTTTKKVFVRPSQPPNPQYYTICRGRADGLIPDPFDCSHYYNCYFQLGIRMSCSYGTVFHQAIQACDYPQNVPGCH